MMTDETKQKSDEESGFWNKSVLCPQEIFIENFLSINLFNPFNQGINKKVNKRFSRGVSFNPADVTNPLNLANPMNPISPLYKSPADYKRR